MSKGQTVLFSAIARGLQFIAGTMRALLGRHVERDLWQLKLALGVRLHACL
jgi:hypothetical protein